MKFCRFWLAPRILAYLGGHIGEACKQRAQICVELNCSQRNDFDRQRIKDENSYDRATRTPAQSQEQALQLKYL